MGEALAGEVGAVVGHERLAFPSYPYEWPAEMLHASGLLTLDLALAAFDEGLGLKDATPWNVLFRGPTPVFVDWLSVERRDAHDPTWLPYAQFVRTFLLPLVAHREFQHAARSRSSCRAATGSSPKTSIARRARCRASSRRCWRTRRCRRGWRAAARPATRQTWAPKRIEDTERARYVPAVGVHAAPPRDGAPRTGRHRLGLDRRTWPTRATTPTPTSQARNGSSRRRSSRCVRRECSTSAATPATSARWRPGPAPASWRSTATPAVAGRVWRRAEAERLDILPLVVNLARPSPATGWRNAECPSFLARAEGHADLVLMLAVLHHLLVTERVPLAGRAEPGGRPDARCRGDRVCRARGSDVPPAHARTRSPAHGPDRPDVRGRLRGALRDRRARSGHEGGTRVLYRLRRRG